MKWLWFSGLLTIFILSFLPVYGVIGQSNEQLISVEIDLNRKPITEALTEEDAIPLNSTGMIARVQCINYRSGSVLLRDVKTTFIVADIDAVSKNDPIEITLNPFDNVTFVQRWEFDNHVLNQDFALISGKYQVRYDVFYTVNGTDEIIRGIPFFIDFNTNPLRSVFGAVSTIAFAVTTFSAVKLVSSLRNSFRYEMENSYKDASFKASSELKSFYQETGFSKIQNEFTERMFGYASSKWKREKCPECGSSWKKDSNVCQKCGITLEQAKAKYSESLTQKAVQAGKEITSSIDGLSLSEVAAQLGDGVTPTADIVELLTFSGLALVQPRLSKNWSAKTRSLVFTGAQWSLYSVFWFNACGISSVSLLYLILAIASGIMLPVVFMRIFTNRIREKVVEYWNKGRI